MIKKSQRKLNIGFSLVMVLFFLLLLQISPRLAWLFVLSLALGFTLQKSRLCFAASFRDPWLVGSTKLTEALIIILLICIPGFAIVYHFFTVCNIPIALNVTPFGIHTFIGGILFGIGMVLAGGCASGTLMRVGEGFAMQMIALVGLIIGAFLGKVSLPYWLQIFHEFPAVFLPNIMGWVPAVITQLLILLLIWQLIRRWQRKRKELT